MSSRSVRLDRLIALSKDPSATEAERELARTRAEELRRVEVEDALFPGADRPRYVEVDDELIDAIDRAMARASRVSSRAHRAARVRDLEHRHRRGAFDQWRDGRGPALGRGL